MSGLILPNKWTSQPQTPVEIDWSNPLVQALGLVDVWIPSNGLLTPTLIRKFTPVVSVGNFSQGVNASGRSLRYTTSTADNGLILANDADELFPVANTTSIFVIRQSLDTTARTSTLFGYHVGTTGPDRTLAHAPYSDGNIYWDLGDITTSTRISVASGGKTTNKEAYTFIGGPTKGREIWRNGRKLAGDATKTGARASTTGSFRIGSASNTTTEASDLEGVNLFIIGSKEWPDWAIKALSDNPWQIFKPQARRIWVAAAGGGDATATITGVSGSAQVGTVSTSGNASVSLPGASGAGSVGNVVASVSAATAITGVNGAGQVGNTTQTGAANVAVSTVAGTGQVGTVSASGIGAPDGNVAITGIAGTGQVGTLAASGNGAVSITGIAATGSVGSVTPSVTVTTTITGAIGTGSVGTTTQTGAANATVSSAVGIGLVGTVSATGTSQDGNAVISGISGIGSVGIVSANDGTVVNNHGFIIIDTEPRLWWKRKPSKLDDKKAEEKIFKVARVIERVVKHVANSNEPSVSKEVYRKAAYSEVAPLLREMPGFDWSPMFRAILTQSKLQEQNRIAAEQAGILAKQEIERIKRIRDDEEALIVLLMGA